jgi:hypothetical protein
VAVNQGDDIVVACPVQFVFAHARYGDAVTMTKTGADREV